MIRGCHCPGFFFAAFLRHEILTATWASRRFHPSFAVYSSPTRLEFVRYRTVYCIIPPLQAKNMLNYVNPLMVAAFPGLGHLFLRINVIGAERVIDKRWFAAQFDWLGKEISMSSYKDIRDVRESLERISTSDWLQHSWGSWQWWLLLFSAIAPWIIWWIFFDRKRGKELLILGLAFSIVAIFLDNLGTFYGLWGYPIKLVPLTVQFIPGDCAVFPVTFMFMNQFAKNRRSFIIIAIVAAAVFSYMIEPIFKAADMYRPHHPRNYSWSFIGFVLVFISVRSIVYMTLKKLA